jgi:hypothetical protein
MPTHPSGLARGSRAIASRVIAAGSARSTSGIHLLDSVDDVVDQLAGLAQQTGDRRGNRQTDRELQLADIDARLGK